MSNEVRKVKKVVEVIKVLKAGVEFYSDAIEQVDNHNVKGFFRDIISQKESAITELQPFAIAEQGEAEDGESIAVNARNIYTALIGMISFDKDHTYINQLEEVEDKTLTVIKEAIDENQPEVCAHRLIKILTSMQICHDDMSALKEVTA